MIIEMWWALSDVADKMKSVFGELSQSEIWSIVEVAGRLGEAEGAEDEVAALRAIAADIVVMNFSESAAQVAAQFKSEMVGA